MVTRKHKREHWDPKWNHTPNDLRKRKNIGLTLSDEAREKLDRLAERYGSRSAAVEALVMAAKG
jgi:hypothetical protein